MLQKMNGLLPIILHTSSQRRHGEQDDTYQVKFYCPVDAKKKLHKSNEEPIMGHSL